MHHFICQKGAVPGGVWQWMVSPAHPVDRCTVDVFTEGIPVCRIEAPVHYSCGKNSTCLPYVTQGELLRYKSYSSITTSEKTTYLKMWL